MNISDRKNWVAIIGSRHASPEESKIAYEFAKLMVEKGKIIVSGLALGIDAEAHRGALDAGGETIAIVSTPETQNIYPKQNRELAQEIKKSGGIIHAFDTPAVESGKGLSQFSKRLIERDLLLAKLCPVIVAVKNDDSPIKGGTRYAVHYGKTFGNYVYRLDNNGKFHENPPTEKADIWWDMELDIAKKIRTLK